MSTPTLNAYYLCADCGEGEWAISEYQAQRARASKPMLCFSCYTTKRNNEQRQIALDATESMRAELTNRCHAHSSGEFPIGFTSGGYVYLLSTTDRTPLYIGATSRQIGKRPFEHKHKPWWPLVEYVEYWFFPTMDDVTTAEKQLIVAIAPQHNTQHAGRNGSQ